MPTRPDRPRDYFAKLLDQPDDAIDYSEIPATTAADWQDAEILLPVTAEEFRAIKKFVQTRRERGEQTHTRRAPQPNKPTLADDVIEALGEAVAHAEGRLDLRGSDLCRRGGASARGIIAELKPAFTKASYLEFERARLRWSDRGRLTSKIVDQDSVFVL